MSEMTLAEAVRLYRDVPDMDEFTWQHVRRTLFAAAERTLAAQVNEPEVVKLLRSDRVLCTDDDTFCCNDSAHAELLTYIDHLTAQLAEARAAHQLMCDSYAKQGERVKALRTERDTLAQIVERVERKLIERKIIVESRLNFDWNSGDTAALEILRDVYDALAPTREGA